MRGRFWLLPGASITWVDLRDHQAKVPQAPHVVNLVSLFPEDFRDLGDSCLLAEGHVIVADVDIRVGIRTRVVVHEQ